VDDDDRETDRMLYDHSIDPGENVNISEDPAIAPVVEAMSAEMRESRAEDYFRLVPAKPSRADSSFSPSQTLPRRGSRPR
jgi:hypothetical protein